MGAVSPSRVPPTATLLCQAPWGKAQFCHSMGLSGPGVPPGRAEAAGLRGAWGRGSGRVESHGPRGPTCVSFSALQELSRDILTEMENQPRHYRPLVCEKSKPVPLKLFTPPLVKV